MRFINIYQHLSGTPMARKNLMKINVYTIYTPLHHDQPLPVYSNHKPVSKAV